jgi:uncharacterized membrane protein (UPF0127 family)
MTRALLLPAVAALLLATSVCDAKVRYATRACANPNLPLAIVDGSPVEERRAPLRTIEVPAKNAKLTLAVADTQKDRELGLMCVTALRPQAGMIFVFGGSSDWEFWMKNTLVRLDMVWVDADGSVTGVAANVPASKLSTPDAKVARRRGHGAYVIELNAGEASRDGVTAGQHVALPELRAKD